jgi:hypothetical protein
VNWKEDEEEAVASSSLFASFFNRNSEEGLNEEEEQRQQQGEQQQQQAFLVWLFWVLPLFEFGRGEHREQRELFVEKICAKDWADVATFNFVDDEFSAFDCC